MNPTQVKAYASRLKNSLHQASGIRHQASGIRHQASGIAVHEPSHTLRRSLNCETSAYELTQTLIMAFGICLKA
jgi:hypothetical protein